MTTATKKGTKRAFTLRVAQLTAGDLCYLLQAVCQKIAIAGSIRRVRDTVHDIDVVVWAKYHDSVTVNLFGEKATVLNPPGDLLGTIRCIDQGFTPPPELDPKILRFTYENMPVEIYLAERDGSNFFALLQMRTGSEVFNTYLARSARHRGLYYRAGYGIYEHDDQVTRGDFGRRLDDGTEEGIFKALDIPYRKPSERF